MKFLLSITVLSLLPVLSALADPSSGPLLVHAPDGWELKYEGENGVGQYTLTGPKAENALLLFSRWPAPGTRRDIPGFLDSMARGFLEAAKSNPKIKLVSESYTKGEFLGEIYSGRYVEFAIQDGLIQTLFMFSDDDGLWNGQYTGTSAGWTKAQDILKGIKKNG